ncbi:YutD family protein [Companilactobacillus furfuricola]|uniref:YutD family protein n=1 Tax=Companilactobacillus furfuricola TaxID=1462575 RepID=UPI000F79544D|nr:YutD family protein [Companilactobacillus furfuricola]
MDEPETKSSKQAVVTVLDDDLVVINKIKYHLLTNHDNGFNREKIEERYNSVLDKYDFIVGDWGYDQLRFKGFYMDKRIESNIDNKISHLQDYLLEYCNFGCAYFILEREDKLPLTKPKHHRSRTHSKNNQHNESNNHRANRNNRHKSFHKNNQDHGSEDKPHIRRRKPISGKAPHKRRQANHKSTSNSGSRSFKIRKIDK